MQWFHGDENDWTESIITQEWIPGARLVGYIVMKLISTQKGTKSFMKSPYIESRDKTYVVAKSR